MHHILIYVVTVDRGDLKVMVVSSTLDGIRIRSVVKHSGQTAITQGLELNRFGNSGSLSHLYPPFIESLRADRILSGLHTLAY